MQPAHVRQDPPRPRLLRLRPQAGLPPRRHPAGGTVLVREDALLARLGEFLSHHVFGAYRRSLLATHLRALDTAASHDREQHVRALRRSIADTETKIKRTVRTLELIDTPDPDLIADITERRAELRAHKQRLEAQLAAVEDRTHQAPNPDLIDVLPVATIQVDDLPEELVRSLFEALRLEIRYNKTTNRATFRITLTGQTLPAAHAIATEAAAAPPRPDHNPDPHPRPDGIQGDDAINVTPRSHACRAPDGVRHRTVRACRLLRRVWLRPVAGCGGWRGRRCRR